MARRLDALGNIISSPEDSSPESPPIKVELPKDPISELPKTSGRKMDALGRILGPKGNVIDLTPEDRKINDWGDFLSEGFRSYISPVIKAGNIIMPTVVGTALGAASPTPGGAALGGILGFGFGDQLNQFAERTAPQYFGNYEPGVVESLIQERGGVQVPQPIGSLARTAETMGVGEGVGRGMKMFGNLVRPDVSSEMTSALKANPQLKPSMGEVFQSPTTKKFENIVTPIVNQRRVAGNVAEIDKIEANKNAQFNDLVKNKSQELAGVTKTGEYVSPEQLAENAKDSIGERKGQLASIANTAYRKNEAIAKLNPVQVVTGYEDGGVIDPATNKPVQVPQYATVRGPVMLQNVVNTVYNELKRQDLLTQNGTVDVAKLANQDAKLYSTYNALKDAFQTDVNGKLVTQNGQVVARPLDYEAIKDIKANLGKKGDWSNSTPNSQASGFRSLTEQTNDDITDSIGRYWKNGSQQALHNHEYGNKVWTEYHRLYGEKCGAAKSILETNDSGKDELKSALQDSEHASRFIAAGGDRKPLAAQNFQNLVQGAYGKDGKFDAAKLEADWTDPNKQELYKKLYSSQTRADISDLITKLKSTNQNIDFLRDNFSGSGTSGQTSAQFKFGGAVVSLMGAALLSTHAPAYSEGALAIGLGTNAISRFVLQNPKYARALATMFKNPPNSGPSRIAAATILGAMNGQPASIILKSGKEIPGVINDGKIEAPQSSQ